MQATPLYYRLAIALIKPLYYLKLALTAKTQPHEINERFANQYPVITTSRQMIWCHAVSLGETNTAAAILKALLADGYALWITNTTHTGYARVAQLFAEAIASGEVYHSFVPIDDQKVMQRFLDHVQPRAALFIETELWANTLALLAERHITSILVNGRLSEKSFQGYYRVAKLSQSMMNNLDVIIAQDDASATRFCQLGASAGKVHIASSLKWSTQIKPNLLAQAEVLTQQWQLATRKIILAASTHAEEETFILQCFAALEKSLPEQALLLIIAPRHPERFDDAATLIAEQGYAVQRRSQQQSITAETAVYLADTIGELGLWYALTDIAFVAGSVANIGGHNPIEAAIVGKPIIMGRYTQSCQQIVEQLHEVGALTQVDTVEQCIAICHQWLTNPEQARQAGEAGQQLAKRYQNADKQQLAIIHQALAATIKD